VTGYRPIPDPTPVTNAILPSSLMYPSFFTKAERDSDSALVTTRTQGQRRSALRSSICAM
jgi:hypothetical protein